jgi:hypothetical protein
VVIDRAENVTPFDVHVQQAALTTARHDEGPAALLLRASAVHRAMPERDDEIRDRRRADAPRRLCEDPEIPGMHADSPTRCGA